MMLDFARMIKECFWDIDIDEADIKKMARGSDFRKKQFIFDKILLNSTKMLNDLNIFDTKELKELLSRTEVPQFNNAHVLRRKNLVEVYFFNADLLISELKWVA